MFVGTDRREFSNQLLVGQFVGRRPAGFTYALDLALSRTQKQEGDGGHVRALAGWQWDYVAAGSIVDYYSINYFPANGLLNGDLPGTWGVKNYAEYSQELAEGLFRTLSGQLAWYNRNTIDGRPQYRDWQGGGSIELRQQVELGLSYSNGYYRPVGEERGQWADRLNHDCYWTARLDFNTRSSWLQYGVNYAWGTLGGGSYSYLAPELWIRPTARTFLKLSTERLQSFGNSDQTMATAGWDLTSQDSLVTRYILANNQHYFRFAYSRQVSAGVDIFVVYDNEPGSPAKTSLKLVFSLL
jgi:hypothetical protein